MIDTLANAVSTLRGGAAALKAENADLRAAYSRESSHARAAAWARGRVDASETLDVPLPLDERAPGAARIVVTACLRDRVPASVLDDAQLVVSQLVSSSLCHSRARAANVVVVRVQLTATMVRLEVADGGRSGVVAPRTADLEGGGGVGLNLGVGRVAASGTRVWAQLPRTPLTAPAFAETFGDVATAPAAGNARSRKPSSTQSKPRRSRSAETS